MLDLIEAEPRHRQFLQQFWCGPVPFRKAKKQRVQHPELYAIRVQSIVRDLRPPAPYPDRLHVCCVDELEMVKSVGWARFICSADGHHKASFYLLATHTVYTNRGAGQDTHSHVIKDLVGIAQDQAVFLSLTVKAIVHPDNDACIRLLSRNGWVRLGVKDVDGVHEQWALRIGVEEG